MVAQMFDPASMKLRVILDKQLSAPADVAVQEHTDESGSTRVRYIYVADPQLGQVKLLRTQTPFYLMPSPHRNPH